MGLARSLSSCSSKRKLPTPFRALRRPLCEARHEISQRKSSGFPSFQVVLPCLFHRAKERMRDNSLSLGPAFSALPQSFQTSTSQSVMMTVKGESKRFLSFFPSSSRFALAAQFVKPQAPAYSRQNKKDCCLQKGLWLFRARFPLQADYILRGVILLCLPPLPFSL
jgi:hypothetical protein